MKKKAQQRRDRRNIQTHHTTVHTYTSFFLRLQNVLQELVRATVFFCEEDGRRNKEGRGKREEEGRREGKGREGQGKKGKERERKEGMIRRLAPKVPFVCCAPSCEGEREGERGERERTREERERGERERREREGEGEREGGRERRREGTTSERSSAVMICTQSATCKLQRVLLSSDTKTVEFENIRDGPTLWLFADLFRRR